MNRSMSDDWDLYAVVRSCTNAAATSTASPTITDAVVAPVKESGEPFLNVPSIHSGDAPSDFPGFINHKGDPFQGLEIYKELLYENTQPQQTPTASNSVLQEFQNQGPPQQHVYPQPHRAIQPQQHLHLSHGMFGSSLSFPSTSPQPIGTRRRKNQHAKMIHQMTQEELSADTWAWRKYGQKPIKGSPYPRNYYRCSTSKGCTARKQVERCPTDPNMYVVSYSGEHSHPRPTHRSSLAGSSRSKISAAAKPTSNSTEPINIVTTPTSRASSIVSCSSASPASTFSLITPISAAEESAEGDGHMENNNIEILLGEQEEDQEEGWTPYDDDDDGPDGDDILIPNSLVTDDLLKGLQFKN